MCLIIENDENLISKIATEDIIVYKILTNDLISPYLQYQYEYNIINESILDSPQKYRIEQKYKVKKGFHSLMYLDANNFKW